MEETVEVEVPSLLAKADKYKEERHQRLQKRRNVKEGEVNDSFREYYEPILKDGLGEEGWAAFLKSLTQPVGMSLRIPPHHPFSPLVIRELNRLGLTPIQRIPGGTTFGCSDELYHTKEEVKQIATTLNSSAFVTFQEVVSMLPPVCVLKSLETLPTPAPSPKTGKVPPPILLDMCAAPGSKTLQVLENLPQGFRGAVLSNEIDRVKASQLLPARLKRAQSECCFSIQGDAARFPFLFSDELGEFVFYDGIVCDVPCSGDGTSRKDATVQETWTKDYAGTLQSTQSAILKRGLLFLKVGGTLVYSTCSLNPVENEKVVEDITQRLLPHMDLETVNPSKYLPDFNWGNVVPTSVPHVGRVLPHTNDTGGFFITVFKKLAEKHPVDGGEEGTQRLPPTPASGTAATKGGNRYSHWGGYKRYRALEASEEKFLLEFYGLDVGKLMNETGIHLVVHGTDSNPPKPRRIVALSEGAFLLLHAKVHKAKREIIETAGVRCFAFCEGAAVLQWRTTFDGAHVVAPHSNGSRIIEVNDMTLLSRLITHNIVDYDDAVAAGVKMVHPAGPVWIRSAVPGA
eukprot:PhF_6_TR42120/c0_g1_i2/m.63611/K15335/NSUN2; tRNA (cytosine34-C5)-methyltransferase